MVHQRKKATEGEGSTPATLTRTVKGDAKGVKSTQKQPTKMEKIFGFDSSDLASWSSFVRLMNRPMDPASLGFTRMIFG